MTGTSPEYEELGEAMGRLVMADELKDTVAKPFNQMLAQLLAHEEVPVTESIEAILLLVFTQIELLGYMYRGENSSGNAVDFVREYLGRRDKRYREVGGLLFHVCRHGLAHRATPKRIELRNGVVLDVAFSFNGERQQHLAVTGPRRELLSTGAVGSIAILSLDLPVLYQDLLSAIDEFAEDIKKEQPLADTFRQAFLERRSKQDDTEDDLLNKSYIGESDFSYVMRLLSA